MGALLVWRGGEPREQSSLSQRDTKLSSLWFVLIHVETLIYQLSLLTGRLLVTAGSRRLLVSLLNFLYMFFFKYVWNYSLELSFFIHKLIIMKPDNDPWGKNHMEHKGSDVGWGCWTTDFVPGPMDTILSRGSAHCIFMSWSYFFFSGYYTIVSAKHNCVLQCLFCMCCITPEPEISRFEHHVLLMWWSDWNTGGEKV